MAVRNQETNGGPPRARPSAALPPPRIVGVERAGGTPFLAEVLRFAARLPLVGGVVRPAAAVTSSVLRRARFAAADLVREDTARVAVRVGAVADLLVPVLVREVLARLDVPALVAQFVDLDRIAALLDVDPVVARVDIDAILTRVDIDAIVTSIDLDKIARSLDLDAIVDRLDLDRAAARLDLDLIIERMDLLGLARYVVEGIDVPQLLRSSTESISQEVVDEVRVSTADADRAVERLVDRLLLRRQGRRTELKPASPPDDPRAQRVGLPPARGDDRA